MPLITDDTKILLAIKSCIVNTHQLDISLSKNANVTNSNTNYALILCAALVIYFYAEKTSQIKVDASATKLSNGIIETNSIVHQKETKLRPRNEPLPSPTATVIKLSNRNETIREQNKNIAKPYPMLVRFPSKVHALINQPVPMVLFPGNSPTTSYIPTSTRSVNQNCDKKTRRKQIAAENTKHKKLSSEYPCNIYQLNDCQPTSYWKEYGTKDVKYSKETVSFIFEENSSTPKKKKKPTKINDARISTEQISETLESKQENVDTRNVLEGLDNLDLEFSDHTITIASVDKDKDAKKMKESIQNEFKNSVQLAATRTLEKTGEKNSNEKENSKYGKDLVERVALKVIGNGEGNIKISSNVNHFMSCPLPVLSESWVNSPANNQYNIPYYAINEKLSLKNMASPLFENPIWNSPNICTDDSRKNPYPHTDKFS